MKLRDLYSFVVVAEEASFTRAARRLHIAQPPLSYRIRQLEERLGVQLLERTTRSVSLTAAGQVYLEHLKPVLVGLEQANEACKLAQSGDLGVLRLGYTGRASQEYLPGLLSRFRAQNPKVKLDLVGPRPTGALELDLMEERLDAALCFLPLEAPEIATRLLFESAFSIVMSDAHPYAHRDTVALSELQH